MLGKAIDQYVRVTTHSGQPVVIHMRFQRIYQPNLGAVVYREAQQLREQYKASVETIVTLLWTGADGPGVTGEHPVPGGEPFRYHVMRLWEKDPDEMFNSPINAVLSPLARFEPERLPEILRRMEEVIENSPEDNRENCWVIAYTNLGLRFPAERVNELLAHRLPAICAAPSMRSTRSAAYHMGHADALRDGDLRASRRWVLGVGRQRLVVPPAELRAGLDTITSLERLEQLAARVLKARDWREALAPN